jgi:hypothetical protein
MGQNPDMIAVIGMDIAASMFAASAAPIWPFFAASSRLRRAESRISVLISASNKLPLFKSGTSLNSRTS